MVSLVINSRSRRRRTNCTAECGGNLPRGRQDIRPKPARTSQMQAGPTFEPSEDSPEAEHEAGQAQTKDGASGGSAEEQTCARGRGMRLLKIGESPDSDARTG